MFPLGFHPRQWNSIYCPFLSSAQLFNQFQHLIFHATRNQIGDYVLQYLKFQPEVIELDESKKLLCWDSAHGNVILEAEAWDTAIILTSNIVKDA